MYRRYSHNDRTKRCRFARSIRLYSQLCTEVLSAYWGILLMSTWRPGNQFILQDDVLQRFLNMTKVSRCFKRCALKALTRSSFNIHYVKSYQLLKKLSRCLYPSTTFSLSVPSATLSSIDPLIYGRFTRQLSIEHASTLHITSSVLFPFPNLVSLCLTNFNQCTLNHIPSSLRKLSLVSSPSDTATDSLYVSDSVGSLSSLSSLSVSNLSVFKCSSLSIFQNLKHLEVHFTSVLDELSEFISLESLVINTTDVSFLSLRTNKRLVSLEVLDLESLTHIDLSTTSKLQTLKIIDCPNITSIDLSPKEKKITTLHLDICPFSSSLLHHDAVRTVHTLKLYSITIPSSLAFMRLCSLTLWACSVPVFSPSQFPALACLSLGTGCRCALPLSPFPHLVEFSLYCSGYDVSNRNWLENKKSIVRMLPNIRVFRHCCSRKDLQEFTHLFGASVVFCSAYD
ncbi:hypothetical protein P9112_009666 [Eukaryota sp. TZLM1-RC]